GGTFHATSTSNNTPTAQIYEGGFAPENLVTITSGSVISPSEYIALVQTTSQGFQFLANQTLRIYGSGPNQGAAESGMFAIASANVPSGGFSNLKIPAGVTAVPSTSFSSTTLTNQGTIGGLVNITATDLTNSGTISPTSGANFTLTANNLTNTSGAVIS